MTDDNTDKNEKTFKKKVGFKNFAFLSFEKEGYVMKLRKYETATRRRIKRLRETKKTVPAEKEKTIESIEKEIKHLKSKLLNNTDNAVFYYFIEHINFKNKVNMNKVKKTQKAIAEELCLDNAEVSRAFKKLKSLNLINFTKSGHTLEKVWVSPYVIWRGKAQDHFNLMNELREEFYSTPFES